MTWLNIEYSVSLSLELTHILLVYYQIIHNTIHYSYSRYLHFIFYHVFVYLSYIPWKVRISSINFVLCKILLLYGMLIAYKSHITESLQSRTEFIVSLQKKIVYFSFCLSDYWKNPTLSICSLHYNLSFYRIDLCSYKMSHSSLCPML